jgi:flagellar motor component MotA
MIRKIFTIDNCITIYTASIPVCSFIGCTLGSLSRINDKNTTLENKFATAMYGTVCGTLVGFVWPIIIPMAIVFTPFAIYDTYNKSIKV